VGQNKAKGEDSEHQGRVWGGKKNSGKHSTLKSPATKEQGTIKFEG